MYVSVLIVTAIAAAIFLQQLEQTLRQVTRVVLEHVEVSNQVVYLLGNVYIAYASGLQDDFQKYMAGA